MKVAFLSIGSDSFDSYYSASIKPFIDLAQGVALEGHDTLNITLNVADSAVRALKKEFTNRIYSTYSTLDARQILVDQRPDYLIFEDFYPKLKTSVRLSRGLKLKTVAYVEILRGMNVLNTRRKRNLHESIAYNLLPPKALVGGYVDMLENVHFVVANSQTTRFLIEQLYGVSCDGVVYPPVGTTLSEGSQTVDRKGIFAYLGGREEYYRRDVIKEIVSAHNESGIEVTCLVSNRINSDSLKLLESNDIRVVSRVSNSELVDLYRGSQAFYSAPSLELFGHTGPESLLFETPVIIDSFQPWLENFPIDTRMVCLSPKDKTLAESFEKLAAAKKDPKKARDFIKERYSLSTSSKSLTNILGVV